MLRRERAFNFTKQASPYKGETAGHTTASLACPPSPGLGPPAKPSASPRQPKPAATGLTSSRRRRSGPASSSLLPSAPTCCNSPPPPTPHRPQAPRRGPEGGPDPPQPPAASPPRPQRPARPPRCPQPPFLGAPARGNSPPSPWSPPRASLTKVARSCRLRCGCPRVTPASSPAILARRGSEDARAPA